MGFTQKPNFRMFILNLQLINSGMKIEKEWTSTNLRGLVWRRFPIYIRRLLIKWGEGEQFEKRGFLRPPQEFRKSIFLLEDPP
jgi:hypothetical protein